MAIRGIAVQGMAIRGIAVRDMAIWGIAVRSTAIRGIAVRGTAVRGIAVRGTALRRTPSQFPSCADKTLGSSLSLFEAVASAATAERQRKGELEVVSCLECANRAFCWSGALGQSTGRIEAGGERFGPFISFSPAVSRWRNAAIFGLGCLSLALLY